MTDRAAWMPNVDRLLIARIRNHGDESLAEASGFLPVNVEELLKRFEAALDRVDELETALTRGSTR